MLYEKKDSTQYIQEFKKRFSNFAEKAPVLLSYTTTPKGVQIVDESTDTVYEFTWEFSIPVKTFIHGIKESLVAHCYPHMTKRERVSVPLTEAQQVELATKGVDLDSLPSSREEIRNTRYLIDRVIVYKDIFLIVEEETQRVFRYKLNKGSIFFLKRIRAGKLSEVEVADYFFENSTLLNEVVPLEQSGEN